MTENPCSPVLSVREELERQKSKERFQRLQMEGKTEQARADLARLAIIKKQREEAARKREELRKGEKATSDTSHLCKFHLLSVVIAACSSVVVGQLPCTQSRQLCRLSCLTRKRSRRSQRKALVLHLNTSTCTSISEGW